jgi:hypothetical protein
MPRSSLPHTDPMIATILTRALLSITQAVEPILAHTAWVTCAQCGMPTIAYIGERGQTPTTSAACGQCTAMTGIPVVAPEEE